MYKAGFIASIHFHF